MKYTLKAYFHGIYFHTVETINGGIFLPLKMTKDIFKYFNKFGNNPIRLYISFPDDLGDLYLA